MKKKILLASLLFLLFSFSVYAQNTNVTATITDAGGQTWNNGTYTFNFSPAPRFNGTYRQNGAPFTPTSISGSLSAVGALTSILVPDNNQITPSGTGWTLTVCAQTGVQCFTSATIVITGASQTISSSVIPPAITVTCGPGVNAYLDSEVSCGIGGHYYNLTNQVDRVCTAVTAGVCTTWNNAGGSSSPTSSLVQSGLLADYLLIDGSGTTIKDSSAAGNNGTFCAGNPTWGASPAFGLTFTAASSQCVVLPAALNAARTFFFYVDTTSGVGNFNAFVAGTVGGSSAAIWYDAAPGQNQGNGFVSTSSSGGATKDFVPITGPGLLAVTFDTVDHHWVNSLEVPNYQNSGTSAGQQSAGVYQLGGSASGLGGATFCNCKMYRVVVYNRVLTAAEMAQDLTVIQSQQAARGLVTNFNSKAVTDQVITVGDSQTAGTGVTTPWPAQMVIGNGSWTVLNAGSSGRTMAGFAKGELQENLPLLHPTPARNMEIILAGTNDIFFGTTPALTEQSQESFNELLQAQRVPTVMCTMVDRTGLSANKNALNTLTRQYFTVFANELCDFAANPSLGADGANASALFFIGDGVHPSQTSHTNIMAPMGQASLNHIHGNRDQSTATVYAAAAAAAVATTVGSEAANTVTLTTAATPANCNVGNLVFVTGVTPAGYNTTVGNGFGLGGANILTRSATQITYYNPTAGLGAVSVQGTIVCPQQQDNDVYQGVNFGAGNYTLQSCELWMGRPISIKNINAVASTVVPWLGLTEQIDGAANLTLAAGATAVLWPRLVSAAAGGCNWFREQNN